MQLRSGQVYHRPAAPQRTPGNATESSSGPLIGLQQWCVALFIMDPRGIHSKYLPFFQRELPDVQWRATNGSMFYTPICTGREWSTFDSIFSTFKKILFGRLLWPLNILFGCLLCLSILAYPFYLATPALCVTLVASYTFTRPAPLPRQPTEDDTGPKITARLIAGDCAVKILSFAEPAGSVWSRKYRARCVVLEQQTGSRAWAIFPLGVAPLSIFDASLADGIAFQTRLNAMGDPMLKPVSWW